MQWLQYTVSSYYKAPVIFCALTAQQTDCKVMHRNYMNCTEVQTTYSAANEQCSPENISHAHKLPTLCY